MCFGEATSVSSVDVTGIKSVSLYDVCLSVFRGAVRRVSVGQCIRVTGVVVTGAGQCRSVSVVVTGAGQCRSVSVVRDSSKEFPLGGPS